jgi:hypothetical protein
VQKKQLTLTEFCTKKGQRIDLFLYEHASLTLISISILPVQHMTGGVCPRSVLMLLLSR